MTKRIGIIGCGWLGLPLASKLYRSGYKVSGTTTSKQKLSPLKEAGIDSFQISISEEQINGPISEFLDPISLLIINIPPGLRGKGSQESYIAKMKLLHTAIKKSKVNHLIFVSSTAVYGDTQGTVTENTAPLPQTVSGIQLLECEELFRTDTDLKTTIIRFGGLIGPDRHPVTMLSGRENLTGGNAPINLIHQEDCIGIIMAIIERNIWGEVLNAVYPNHPKKEDYYTKEALKRGIPSPNYQLNDDQAHKTITSSSTFYIDGYSFITPID